jgi:Gluconate 2-dehydrogenase subunit 3
MHDIKRRAFMRGAALGALAFTVGGVEVLITPGEARSQGVPFRLLKANEGETIEALGETLVPGARKAGIAHFIDHQISVPAEEALLQARIFNVRPPFANFYRAAVGAIDRGGEKVFGRKFAQLTTAEQVEFVGQMRQNKIEGWTGPSAAFVYTLLRTDAVDVVYGTMEGYAALGIPYQAHIEPEKRW